MTNCGSCRRIVTILVVVMSLLSLLSGQENAKKFHYTVGQRAIVSITNNYGPVTVIPSGSDQVSVTTWRTGPKPLGYIVHSHTSPPLMM